MRADQTSPDPFIGPAHIGTSELSGMSTKHSYLMVGLVVIGAVLLLSGSGGGAVFLLWPLACMGMMFAMMWWMGGGMSRNAEHTHDDGVTHSHS